MAYWLVKSDPEAYGFAELERDRSTTWDGVSNNLALKHVRQVRRGDQILIYHSGEEKSIVGVAEATSDAYPDPKAGESRLAVFDLRAVRRVAKPVTLAAIKGAAEFAKFELVRMPRLSVMPVPPALWERLLGMAGESRGTRRAR